jgi:hypothetical protein
MRSVCLWLVCERQPSYVRTTVPRHVRNFKLGAARPRARRRSGLWCSHARNGLVALVRSWLRGFCRSRVAGRRGGRRERACFEACRAPTVAAARRASGPRGSDAPPSDVRDRRARARRDRSFCPRRRQPFRTGHCRPCHRLARRRRRSVRRSSFAHGDRDPGFRVVGWRISRKASDRPSVRVREAMALVRRRVLPGREIGADRDRRSRREDRRR